MYVSGFRLRGTRGLEEATWVAWMCMGEEGFKKLKKQKSLLHFIFFPKTILLGQFLISLLAVSANVLSSSSGCPALELVPVDRFSLVVGIPTVPRHRLEPGEEHYLTQALASLAREMDRSTLVVVVANSFEPHPAFDRASQLYSGDDRFAFCHQPVGNDLDKDWLSNEDEVPFRVFKQSRDVINAMTIVSRASLQGQISHYLIAEDDFVACAGSWTILRNAIPEADAKWTANWSALRVSFGFNGLVLRTESVPSLIRYLTKHAARRPPDHLAVEYFAKETSEARAMLGAEAVFLVLRENLMEHIGKASSLRPRRDLSPYLACGAVLGPPVLFHVEAYDDMACKNQLVCAAGLDQRRAIDVDEL